jgi:hypothetical protein
MAVAVPATATRAEQVREYAKSEETFLLTPAGPRVVAA